MKVTVLNYNQFWEFRENHNITDFTVEDFNDMIFISILDSALQFSKRQFQSDHKNAITLQFDDVTVSGKPSPTNHINTRAFDESDGLKIITLLDNNKDAKYCIVHCAAGISRSGAVGQFVNDYFRGDYNNFKRHNTQIMPNTLITRILNFLIR